MKINVRIAIAVDEQGDWYALGGSMLEDEYLIDNVSLRGCVNPFPKIFMLTADADVEDEVVTIGNASLEKIK